MTPRPAPPTDLAGRFLAKFFTDYLAGERSASPRTVASYRDAMKLLLAWFKDEEHIAPEKLRLADMTGPGSFGSSTGWRPSGAARRPPATSASR